MKKVIKELKAQVHQQKWGAEQNVSSKETCQMISPWIDRNKRRHWCGVETGSIKCDYSSREHRRGTLESRGRSEVESGDNTNQPEVYGDHSKTIPNPQVWSSRKSIQRMPPGWCGDQWRRRLECLPRIRSTSQSLPFSKKKTMNMLLRYYCYGRSFRGDAGAYNLVLS